MLAIAAPAQAPVGDVVTSDATVKGSVVLAGSGTRLLSGSSVTAGISNASVRLLRGGEVRVCQGSSVSFTTSASGREIMVGMSSGTVEAHYPLADSTDTLVTPDFQISLSGPGIFHLAVSSDASGNTCVQPLHGNTGSAKVSELMGDGSYTLRPDEEVIFRAGNASHPMPVTANCGCPQPVPVMRVTASPLPKAEAYVAAAPPPAAPLFAGPDTQGVTAPPPAEKPGQIHVQVEAPFVFRASELPPAIPDPPVLAQLRLASLPVLPVQEVLPPPLKTAQAEPPVQPVAQAQPRKKRKRGFWALLASIFGGG